MNRILKLLGRDSFDMIEAWRQLLHNRIAALESGHCQLRIPQVRNQMKVVRGMHFHLVPELFIQVSGYTLFQFPQERQWTYPGEICIVPQGMPHGETVGAYEGPFHNFVTCGDQEQLAVHVAYERSPARPGILKGTRFTANRLSRRALRYLDDAALLHNSPLSGHKAATKGLLLAALVSLLGCIDKRQTHAPEESFKIRRCRQLIMTRLSNPELNVATLAEWLHCSADYLSHLFHQETGTTLIVHINEQRIMHARTLLESTSLNISETARATGYHDPGYFTRVFRKSTGMSPRKYRDSLPKRA